MSRKRHTLRERDPELPLLIGTRIREFRLAAGMTQAALAEGWCSKAAISSMESAKTMPSIDALSHIAERLAIPLSAFVTPDDGGRAMVGSAAHIRAVEIDRGRVVAELTDGRIVGIPLRSIEGLLDASLRSVGDWRLAPGKRAIEWPALGIRLELTTLLGIGEATADGDRERRGRPARRISAAAVDQNPVERRRPPG